ncbi:hypothetical protein HELRODRAFT_177582 [Helobdella robusta]|uniref:Aminoacyl-transfer RNA synthetases class-II family profile domain-containing protein n=1 Tax=Helobdella robusta TaxID=6412 RepID=T1FBW3_HELRO|nr:hypothetical protein HELRODRAFT_177582 [Helobdella robusta]ESN97920.1 hypothetical protein HELRODRAFT_177582 [Helobdella robusta]
MLKKPFSRVYSFGPTFRAEDSHTRHHLSEFYMLEAEVAFTRSLCDVIKWIEGLIKCMTFAVLERCSSDVQFFFKNSKSAKLEWGADLHKEHERFLTEYFNDVPVFVTDYPAAIKPFYARDNGDRATVASLDLLFSDVGEVCGGSLREERYDFLKSKLEQLNLCKSLEWYLDLRKFGSCPHGGFGLGFERYIQMLLGLNNIKDAIPFPRYTSSCKL